MKFLQIINSKVFKIITWSVLGVGFVSTLAISIFGFGDFKEKEETRVRGVLKYDTIDYESSYLAGEHFIFNKDNSVINLFAIDPNIDNPIKANNLAKSQYGFKKNGEGEFCLDANDIVIDSETRYISVVSKKYESIYFDLNVEVFSPIDENLLTNSLSLEAENAEMYSADNKLLTGNSKTSYIGTNQVEYSNGTKGTATKSLESGMKIKFNFYSSTSQTVDLVIKCCQRKAVQKFDDGYKMTINGKQFTTGVSIPKSDGYWKAYNISDLRLDLKRGFNIFVFEYGSMSPHNLDAIVLTSLTSSLYSEGK